MPSYFKDLFKWSISSRRAVVCLLWGIHSFHRSCQIHVCRVFVRFPNEGNGQWLIQWIGPFLATVYFQDFFMVSWTMNQTWAPARFPTRKSQSTAHVCLFSKVSLSWAIVLGLLSNSILEMTSSWPLFSWKLKLDVVSNFLCYSKLCNSAV